MTEQTKVTLQDMIDRGFNPAGWTVVADGNGNFILTEPSGGGGGEVDQIGIYALQDGVPFGTGTWLNIGDNLKASLSGTVIALDGFAPGIDQIGVFLQDEGIGQGTGTILNFVGVEVTVSVSGTIAQIAVGDPAGGTGTTVVFNEDSLVGSFSEMRYKGGGVDVYNSGTYAAIEVLSPPVPTVYTAKVVRTSAQGFVNEYTILWTAAPDDDEGMWRTGTTVYMCRDGVATVQANCGFSAGGGAGRWWLKLFYNGAQVAYHSDHISDWNMAPHASVSTSIPVTSGSYFQVELSNKSGSTKSSDTDCMMTVMLIES